MTHFAFGLINSVSGYAITAAALFNGGDLSRTFGAPTDNTTWSKSFWFLTPGTDSGVDNWILGASGAGLSLDFPSAGLARLWNNASSAVATSTAVLRDPQWQHGLLVSNGTNIKFLHNGTEIFSYTGTVTDLNSAVAHYIGASSTGGNNFDGYLAQAAFFDGVEYSYSDVTDGVIGNPNPIDLIGLDYSGNNSSLLMFEDGALGTDSSPKGNNYTVNGDVTSVPNTPTDVFCTLEPHDQRTSGTLSGGLLSTTGNAAVTLRPSTGEWYYEKDGVGVSYDADVSGQFDPVLTSGTYNFGATAWSDTGPTGNENPISVEFMPKEPVTSFTSIVGFNYVGGLATNISGPTVTATYGTGFVTSNAVATTNDVDNPIGGTVMPRGQAN